MQNRNDGSECYDADCDHNYGGIRPHVHVMTNDGSYVKFIVPKPKEIRLD
jgi:hypothetical protein